MAGAGQPFYMPLTWPIGHLASGISKSADEVAAKPTAVADLDLIGHATSFFAATRSFLMALLCIYVLHEDGQYPAFGPGKELKLEWMLPILIRNLFGAWIICGFWDYFLYASPLHEKLHKYKLNPVYPKRSQFIHDALYTTSAMFTAAAIEIGMCHVWAIGAVPFQANMMDTPVQNFFFALGMTHWRVPHFWAIHRGMHPWFKKSDSRWYKPDVGRFLYKHVHSEHHKSSNPTSWSGTSMHPVESFMYFAAALICVPFGCHPAIVLGCIIDCAVGAWLGHDGFQWPGSGDYFHQLHHQFFDCNYGAMHVPCDKWLGTFSAGKGDKTDLMASDNKTSEAGDHGLSEAGGKTE